MESNNVIQFEKERSFGELINATFSFLVSNFKGLGKSLLFYAGPFIVLAIIGYGFLYGKLFTRNFSDPYAITEPYFPPVGLYFLMMILLLVGYAMIITVIYSYITLYIKEGKGNFKTVDVWGIAKQNIGKIILLSFVGSIFIGIGSILLVIPGIYLMVAMSFMFVAAIHNNYSFNEALSKSFNVVKGHWWQTFGLMIVLGIIQYIIMILIMLPYMLVTGLLANTMNMQLFGIISIIFMIISMLVSVLFFAIPFTALAFQYFNIIEKKEKPSLTARINNIKADEPEQSI